MGESVQNSVETSDREFDAEGLGWLLVGGGVAAAVVIMLRSHRRFGEWLLPLGLAGGGAALLLGQRRKHIEEAKERVLADLEALDPIAKAQVLKAVAVKEFRRGAQEQPPESE